MSLITTCPQCSTSFRVTPDQLRAHAGKVRCGQCSQVFDAFQLLGTLPAPTADAPATAAPMPPETAAVPQQETYMATPSAAPVYAPDEQAAPTEIVSAPEPVVREQQPEPANEPTAEPVAEALAAEPPLEKAFPAVEPAPTEIVSAPEPVVLEQQPESAIEPAAAAVDIELLRTQDLDMTAAPAEAIAPAAAVEPELPPNAGPDSVAAPEWDAHPYAAVAQPEPYESVEEEPPKRRNVLWALAAVVAAVALIVQILQAYRDELAAKFPAFKPALVQFCEYASCAVRPLQRPEALKIEASDLQATDPSRPNVIQLTATLRNYSGDEVGYPALDLVLTDNREHTLVRRVFSAAEYLARADAPVRSIAANAEITVRIDIDIGNVAAAGFRLNLVRDISI